MMVYEYAQGYRTTSHPDFKICGLAKFVPDDNSSSTPGSSQSHDKAQLEGLHWELTVSRREVEDLQVSRVAE
jgi:hypothetical protein